MDWKHVGIFVLGTAATTAASAVAKTEKFHSALVSCTAGALKVRDKIAGFTQSVIDEASDINAEAARKAKIDAAVAERLAQLEEGIRAEVAEQIDAAAAKEAKAKK